MAFTADEADYLDAQPIVRLATVGVSGQPDVVPLAFERDGTTIWIGGTGESFLDTRKVANITAGRRNVALVVDDMVSFDPFIARGIRIYGRAEDPVRRTGIVGPGWYVRISPTESWSWNMAGEPPGDEWYRTEHRLHDDEPETS